MKKAITICTLILICTIQGSNLKAQTTLPYYTGFDNATEKAGWQEFRKGSADPSYHWSYISSAAYTAPFYLDHHYPVGGTVVTDDWFVSPGFTMAAGGRLDSIRSAFSGFGTPTNSDTVAIYILVGSPDPALAISKTRLLDYRGTAYLNDNTWRVNSAINIAPKSGTCYLAIRYKTINNWLDVKFDNVKISSGSTSGIKEKTFINEAILVYPNPASTQLTIQFNEKTPATQTIMKVYNPLGQLQLSQPIVQYEHLNLNLINGTYYYTIETTDQLILKSGKLLIQND